MSGNDPHAKTAPPCPPPLPVGTNRCRCTACGRSFGGVGGFDAHQRLHDGELTCLDPATLGMVERGGWWVRETPRLMNGVGREPTNGAMAAADAIDATHRPNGPTPLGEGHRHRRSTPALAPDAHQSSSPRARGGTGRSRDHARRSAQPEL